MPSFHGRVGPTSLREVIDKMKHRLSGWKASALSKAGRVTMISSTTVLSVSVCKEMEKICRDFLWHGNSSDKKLHLVNWVTVTKPKHMGGLGIHCMRHMNQALMGKLAWRALHSCDELWAKFFGASMNWRAVCFGLELLRKRISHNVVSGNEILFWTDSWLSIGPLIEFALVYASHLSLSNKIRNYWIEGVGWNWDVLRKVLPQNILSFLQPLTLSNGVEDADGVIWSKNSSGRYSVKSGYEARGTQQVRMFMWEIAHGKIMCNIERKKKGFTNFDGCGLCSSAPKMIFHVLRDCPLAMRLWNQLGAEQIENNFFRTNDVFRWLASNL
ncbi:hypothetical protein MANES_12G104550v8 [Manihot esculenta]|uniref:Uncharacterized protein n=1 Tax=Manihot esculenta TaxID=3983 RepID=A0ACB7GSZ2_MANES|nr:hypothetical protein MANES_12G104550v8 [Manihot esculenta]